MTSNELRNLIDALYDGSATVEESGAMLTRCHQIIDELSHDAKRYAFIRDELAIGQSLSWTDTDYRWKFESISGKHKSFDAAIDAAMEASCK